MKYKLEVIVDPSEISCNDTHILITKNTPDGIATFSFPAHNPKFTSKGFKGGNVTEHYNKFGWILKEENGFSLYTS